VVAPDDDGVEPRARHVGRNRVDAGDGCAEPNPGDQSNQKMPSQRRGADLLDEDECGGRRDDAAGKRSQVVSGTGPPFRRPRKPDSKIPMPAEQRSEPETTECEVGQASNYRRKEIHGSIRFRRLSRAPTVELTCMIFTDCRSMCARRYYRATTR
jgi:hypothetical protein